ncbi:hypothetical protein D9758_007471 [Tetrapyrgos nigripes]|uniref:MBOAT-domain-containing protein n=1 Tax=Tetrapyrgos nigripes TaxID=182062 RepID=A0A8H5G388_9AGAR|nr:hypothetical protein D9758_007471 [Tetrapyrgos nigripes]
MDAIFLPLSNALGASLDQVKLIFCLLVAYPLGSIYIRIPSDKPTLKHLFSIAVTLFYFFPMLNMYSAFFQLLVDVLVTYYLGKSHSPNMPWMVFGFALGHLMINHIIRIFYGFGYETIEVTGPQMVLVMKLTTFAWNVVDGRRPAEDLDKWQTAKVVRRYPSLVEFLGYCFYFPGVLVGPYLEYADYQDVVNEITFKERNIKGHKGRNVPDGRKRVGYRRMLMGLFYLGMFVVFHPSYNFSKLITPEFAAKPFVKSAGDHYIREVDSCNQMDRFALTQIYGILERCKYYAIWTLTEGASILTGYGFTGITPSGKTLWNGAANVNAYVIEMPENFKVLLDAWNMKTNVWLRECVYKRVTPKDKKPGFKSSMITFGTSAFWHGTAIGYYLTFFMGGFITTVARLVRKNIRPIFLNAPNQPPSLFKRLYDIIGIITSLIVLNYVTAPFMLLTFKDSIQAWSNLGWYGHYIVFGGLAFFYAGGARVLRPLHPKVQVQVQGLGVTSSSTGRHGNGIRKENGQEVGKETKVVAIQNDTDTIGSPVTPIAEKSGFQVPPPWAGIARTQ